MTKDNKSKPIAIKLTKVVGIDKDFEREFMIMEVKYSYNFFSLLEYMEVYKKK